MARLETDRDLVEAWEAAGVIRRRMKAGSEWLDVPSNKQEAEGAEGDRVMSTMALARNADAVLAVARRYAPKKVKVKTLMQPIYKLYESFSCIPNKTQCYVDAWLVRRLYTYARRRQRDALRRDQTPRAPQIASIALFQSRLLVFGGEVHAGKDRQLAIILFLFLFSEHARFRDFPPFFVFGT